jgi:hypothetical protein
MKPLLFSLFFLVIILLFVDYLSPEKKKIGAPTQAGSPGTRKTDALFFRRLKSKAAAGKTYASQNGLSTRYSFLIDMSLPSGRNRFFVYHHGQDTIIYSGLVAHGSCRSGFLQHPRFSNKPDCGCSSLGRYKTGYTYNGTFGKAFKLFGMDSTNSNSFRRLIVLHAYHAVPTAEVHPRPIINSLGCPMVSPDFLKTLSAIIEKETKPVLLWIYQ